MNALEKSNECASTLPNHPSPSVPCSPSRLVPNSSAPP